MLIALWFATPNAYKYSIFHAGLNNVSMNQETKLQAPEHSDIDKYDKPVYFNIFKFVNNFIPVKRPE